LGLVDLLFAVRRHVHRPQQPWLHRPGFIFCVRLIPGRVAVLWMTAIGGTAIGLVNAGISRIADKPLEQMALAAIISSTVCIVVVIMFFVTFSASGSLVIDTITADAKVDAQKSLRVFWCIFEGLVAIALLLGGGSAVLLVAAVSTGLPFGSPWSSWAPVTRRLLRPG